LILCDAKGRFLYEVLPEYFPDKFLTETEVELWALYFDEKEKRRKK
jgi:hypothetical protein